MLTEGSTVHVLDEFLPFINNRGGGGGGRLANSTGGLVRYLLMRVLSRL